MMGHAFRRCSCKIGQMANRQKMHFSGLLFLSIPKLAHLHLFWLRLQYNSKQDYDVDIPM